LPTTLDSLASDIRSFREASSLLGGFKSRCCAGFHSVVLEIAPKALTEYPVPFVAGDQRRYPKRQVLGLLLQYFFAETKKGGWVQASARFKKTIREAQVMTTPTKAQKTRQTQKSPAPKGAGLFQCFRSGLNYWAAGA